MASLPVCRWREVRGERVLLCNSTQFSFPPNVVTARNCRDCSCPDHAPVDLRPRPLPCVHLGRRRRVESDATAGSDDPLLFECALHSVCVPDTGDRRRPLELRRCGACADYLPRDPLGDDSATMFARAEQFLSSLPADPDREFQGRGIIIAGGGERFFPMLYVTIRAIRHVGCTLPIEVWFLGHKREMPISRQRLLAPFGVTCIDADEVGAPLGVTALGGWELKVFATLHCRFQEVLHLDADCYPCRNPEILFELADYRACGAIFWPDIMERDPRLQWSAFGVLDPHYLGTIESGQFVVDKRICWRPLSLAWFYNRHSRYYYRYCYGDKHTFEVAWARCGTAFCMWQPQAKWVDVAYVHGGPDQEPLFIHRVQDKFRLATHQYTTSQLRQLPGYYSTLPMEAECWGWLDEIARLLRKPRPERGAIKYHRARTRPGRRRTAHQRALRLAIATMWTREIAELGELTSKVLLEYAKRQGYDVALAHDTLDASRHPAWSKLLLVEQILREHPEIDWLMWIDADAVIMDRSRRLECFLDADCDFLVAEDVAWSDSTMNTGVFFLRNCPAVIELLQLAYSKVAYLKHCNWEQPALAEAACELADTVRTRIVPRDLFNVFFDERQPGDFIVHVPGGKYAAKLAAIRHLIAGSQPRRIPKKKKK